MVGKNLEITLLALVGRIHIGCENLDVKTLPALVDNKCGKDIEFFSDYRNQKNNV